MIGDRIVELREKHRLSQGQLAEILGVSRQAVSKWESGKTSPDTLNLIRLADVLDTEVEYLATGKMPIYEPAPVMVNLVEKVDKVVDRVIEKPVIKRVVRIRYRQNPLTLIVCGLVCFVLGVALGVLL